MSRSQHCAHTARELPTGGDRAACTRLGCPRAFSIRSDTPWNARMPRFIPGSPPLLAQDSGVVWTGAAWSHSGRAPFSPSARRPDFSILRTADFDRISVARPPPRGAEVSSRPSAFHCSKPAVPRPHARRRSSQPDGTAPRQLMSFASGFGHCVRIITARAGRAVALLLGGPLVTLSLEVLELVIIQCNN